MELSICISEVQLLVKKENLINVMVLNLGEGQ